MNKKLFNLKTIIQALDNALDSKCQQCDESSGDVKHTCPFKEEIGGDSETLCNCCYDCRNECAMDI